MQLTTTFTVAQPVDRTWAVITDVERVAPYLPGATLLGQEGGDHRGAVTVTVGPVTARYEGVARFVQRDDAGHHAVLRAEGRDLTGQGAAATIDLRVRSRGAGSEVRVDADLELAGRVARVGPGVIAGAGGKLIGRFARRLEEELARDGAAAPAEPPAVARTDDVAPLDVTATATAGTVRRHALPVAAVAAAVLGLLVARAIGRPFGPLRGGRAAAAVSPFLRSPDAVDRREKR